MSIRPATPDDAPALSKVKIAAWRDVYAGIFPAEFLDGLDYPPQYWTRHMTGLLVAEQDDDVVGYCSYAEADDEGWGEVRAIYVHPDSQGEGYGSALLSEAVERLGAMGLRRALLWVIDSNSRARSFYASRGWRLGIPFRLENIAGTDVTLVRYELTF